MDCIDIDECTDANLNDCDVNAKCLNLEGSFNCTCEDGFEGNGEYCHPVFVAKNKINSFKLSSRLNSDIYFCNQK